MTAKKVAKKGGAGEEIRYADAMAELERILEALEEDSIDVDQLAAQVKRASELIRLCRARLTHTQVEIEQVVAEFDASDADQPDSGA